MPRKKYYVLVILIFIVCSLSVTAQTLPDSTLQKIDLIFSQWKSDTEPGITAAIVIGTEVVYANGFGMANLELDSKNSAGSVFYLASLAKQFTGYAVSLLAGEGKLSLDDDIHKHLPWLNDFKHKLTIRNLLNHTSGIRDDIGLLGFTGLNLDGLVSQNLALGYLKKERTLNFVPGEKFSYCNSNYVLLAEIVQQVTGKPYPRVYGFSSI